MSTKKTSRRRPARPDESARRPARKTLQLCGQVARTLNGVLAGLADDVLRNLLVDRVEPAPDESHLLVTVRPMVPADDLHPAAILAHLAQACGLLRTEVASALTRRHTPNLSFQVATPPPPG